MRKIVSILSVTAMAAAVIVGSGQAASANSAYSSKIYYSGSTYLWSYAYIDDSADSSGCGRYNTWSKVTNAQKPTTSIRVTANFRKYGLGSLTVGGGSSVTVSSSDVSRTWINTNGATGSYLSGNVCASFAIVYVGLQASGVGVYNGTVRNADTKWL